MPTFPWLRILRRPSGRFFPAGIRHHRQHHDAGILERVVEELPVGGGGLAGDHGRQAVPLVEELQESGYAFDVVGKAGAPEHIGGGLPLDGHDAPEFVYVYSDVVHFLFFIFTSLAVDWIRPAEDSHSSARRYFAIRIP